jgi:hypothetical protein
MRKLLRLTILGGLMVLFGGAAEDGMVFGIGSAQARIGRPLTPMSYAGVARPPLAALTGAAITMATITTTNWRVSIFSNCGNS